MSERVQRRRSTQEAETDEQQPTAQPVAQASDYDAILDEIDAVLETDAAAYVRNFVQRGGQ